MNLEELMQNPEVKQQLDAMLEEKATAKVQEATAGLINKRDELLAEKKAKQAELEELKSKFDPDKYEQALSALKEQEEAKLSSEELWAKREQELLNSFKTRETELMKNSEITLEQLKSELEAKDNSLKKTLIDGELNKAIAGLNGVPELLVPVLRDKLRVVEENGEYVARVFDGDVARIGGSDGSAMTIEQLVAETKANPIFGGAFRSSGATGGGSEGSNSSGTGGLATKRSEMSVKEKSEYIAEKGYDAYMQLDY